MGVYIKGMEMPNIPVNNGIGCCLFKSFGGDMRLRNNETGQVFDLVSVPPHGRLIDADALKASLAFAEKTAEWAVPALRAVLMVIDEMPTIIPAEEGET